MKQLLTFSLIFLLFAACEVAPQKIAYGTDACHFCDMTIVDSKFAAQLVTSKGKAYKYDAIECMIHSYQDEFKDTEMAYKLVADFDNPGEFIDAENAGYLISEQIKSPMGKNLSAYQNNEKAEQAKENFTGNTYSWSTIIKHLN